MSVGDQNRQSSHPHPCVVVGTKKQDTGSSIATPAQRRREAAQIVQRERVSCARCVWGWGACARYVWGSLLRASQAYRVLKKARNDRQRTLDLMYV